MSDLQTSAISYGGTSFDTATCIGGYKNDPFAVFNASGVIYYHDMLQTRSEYQTPSLNKTMVTYDASTAPDGVKPSRSPFADDSSAYFVGDDNFQDAGQGLVRFRRTFSRIPSNYKEPYGLYNRMLPSITATNFYAYYNPILGSNTTEKDNDSLTANPLLADDCSLSYYFGTREQLENAGDTFSGLTPHRTFNGSDSATTNIFSIYGMDWEGNFGGTPNSPTDRGMEDFSSKTRSTIDTMHYRAKFVGKLDVSGSNGSEPHEWLDNTGVYLDVGFKCMLIMQASNSSVGGTYGTSSFSRDFETDSNGFGNNVGRNGLSSLLKKANNQGDYSVEYCDDWNNFYITEIDRTTGEFTAITDIRSDLVDIYNSSLNTNTDQLDKFYVNWGEIAYNSGISPTDYSNFYHWKGATVYIGGIAFSTGQNRAFQVNKNLPARISYRFIKSDNLDNMQLAGVFEYPTAITASSVPNTQTWATLVTSDFFSAENEFIERYLGNIYRVGQIQTRLE